MTKRQVAFFRKNLDRRFFKLALFILFSFSSAAAHAGLGASVTLASGQPSTIAPSGITQLEITLSNSNTAAAISSVAFSNNLPGTLPNGLKVSGTPTYTCTNPAGPTVSAGSGTLTAANNTQAISLSGGVIPARANNTDGFCTIKIPVTAGTSNGSTATYNYTILNAAVTGNDGSAISNSGDVSQSINVSAISKPGIAKYFSDSNVTLGGDPSTLTIIITNPNSIPITNFSVTDNFPIAGPSSIIKVANPVVSSSSCTGAGVAPTFSPTANAETVTATGGTIAANGSCTITVDIVANQTNGGFEAGFLNNTIAGATDFTSDIGIIPDDAYAQIRAQSPLYVLKSFANGSMSSGASNSFTVTFYNAGLSPITINSFTDSPIDGVGNASYGLKVSGAPVVSCGGSGVAGTYAITSGNLGITQTSNTTVASHDSCQVTTPFIGTVQTANTPISFTNEIPEGAVGTTNPGIVSLLVAASVLVSDELRILKDSSPAIVAPGNPIRYDVTVENWSASTLTNVVVDDNFANGQTFLTGVINGVDYTPTLSGTGCSGLSVSGAVGAAVPQFTIGSVPARNTTFSPGSCVIRFWAMTSTSATNNSTIDNIIGAGDVCHTSGTVCNGLASNATTSTTNTNVLQAAKSFSPAGPLSEGTVTTMTITLSNLSTNAITNVSLSDTLPSALSGGGQLRIAPTPNAASNCGSPSITATANSTSVTMNNATIPARDLNGLGDAGTCFIQVDVVGPAGTYNNIASVDGVQKYANNTTANVGPIDSNTATLTYTSSLSGTKTFLPASVSSGGKSRVTIRLANSGSVALTNVGLTDPLPTGMVLANPVGAYSTCDGTVNFTGNAGDDDISMTGANLAGNGTCDVIFNVVATGSANWTNTIPVGGVTADGDVSNQTAIVGTLNYNAPVGLTVAKATSPSTLTFPGQISELTITLTNGTSDVTNLSLTDYFTTNGTSGAAVNGMKIAPTPAASTTCTGGTLTASAGATAISISGVSISANASCTITVNVTSTSVGGITNFIPIGSIITDQGLTNSGQATTSLTTQANIGIAKQFTPNIIKPGERSRLRITFYNPTAQPASSVGVTDNLPTGVTVPSGANPTTTCTGGSITAPTTTSVQISGANILPASGGVSASCYSEIDVTSSTQGDYLNTIPTSALTATVGGAPATNSQPTSDTLRVKSPIEIHKAIDSKTLDSGSPSGFTTGSASAAVGETKTLTISLTNPNNADLTAASFIDVLPAGLVVAATPNASTTCTSGVVTAAPSDTALSLTGATIPASGSCTVSVSVLSNSSGSYVNTIAASSITTFQGVTNDEPTSAELIVSTPPTVTKQFSPAVIASGGISTLTIFLGNDNESALTLTSIFTDNLPTAPGNVLIASIPNVVKTCPGTVTATAGASSVSYANGSLIPVGGCTISVDVTATTVGDYNNNIPAGRLQTNLGNNQQPANATLKVNTLGFISGKVFRDNNVTPDGIFQAGTDLVITGSTIELRSGANCSGGLITSQTTDAAGNYLFSDLSAGTYSVCQPSQTANTNNGITTAGSIVSSGGSTGTVGVASNPTSTTSQIIGVVLNGDGSGGKISGSINNDFAEVVPSTISGKVFLDQNNNGVQNGSDTGINLVTIELLDSIGTVITSQQTDSSGNYSFTNLEPGTYSVREPTQPTGTANGITTAGAVENGGTAGTATAPSVAISRISNIILPPNTISSDNNFAEISNGRTISGTVFLDYNNSGTLNGSDYGLGSVSLTLSGSDVNGNSVSASTTTNSDGTYSFTSLPPGTYTISQLAQPADTTNGITTEEVLVVREVTHRQRLARSLILI